MRRAQALLLTCVSAFVFAGQALGQGLIIVPEPIPHPRIPGRITTLPLEAKYLRVYAEIVDGVATTRVQQSFVNPLNRPIEGTYVFPLPDDVAVGDFEMTCGGKTLRGEVLDKERARETYERIVRQTRDPALLEFLGSRLYQASVAPIPPGAMIDLTLTYTATLSEQNGMGQYVHPLRTMAQAPTAIGELVVQTKIRSALPLATVYCPSHACSITRPSEREAIVSFEQTQVRPDRDFQVFYQRRDAQFGMILLTHHQPGEPGYFLLRIAPRIDIDRGSIQPKDIAFVVDTSGSMQGAKLAQAQRALKFCINGLGAQDRFNIYGFATEVRPFRDGLLTADDESRKAACDFVDKMQALGGTNIHQALLAALSNDPRDETRPYMIVFVTDGMPTVDVTDPKRILDSIGDKNSRRVRFHVFGVGHDVNTHLLDKLAELNRGSRDYCTENEDLELKLSHFAGRLANPVLTDVNVNFGPVATSQLYPTVAPDLFHGGEILLVGRYEGEGSAAIRVDGKLRGEAKSFTLEGTFPRVSSENDFLPRLWANRRVGYLLEQIRLNGSNRELVDEVVRLAKRFGIVTPYTSALILDETANSPGLATAAPAAMRRLAEKKVADAGGDEEVRMRAAGGRGAVEASRQLRDQSGALALGDDADVQAEGRLDRSQMSVQYVASRVFMQDGARYVDTQWDHKQTPKQVKAFSPDWFALLTQNTQHARFMALGTNVLFVAADGQAYEVLP